LAALLSSRGFDVLCIASKERVEWQQGRSIRIRSKEFGDFEASVRFDTSCRYSLGLLLVTCKSPNLKEAIPRVEFDPKIVVPLLNGIGHYELLKARFPGSKVIPATI